MIAGASPMPAWPLAVPVTVPYQRYSHAGRALVRGPGRCGRCCRLGPGKSQIDGLTVSSFSLAPDTAVGVTQHLGLSPRWLDHIPTGGASGVMALRRAARAVQCGDAEVVACVAGDTNHVDSFRQTLGAFSHFARDASYPYGAGGPTRCSPSSPRTTCAGTARAREDFGRIAVAQRTNALGNPNALFKKPLTSTSTWRRAHRDPIHLFDCVMPCAGAEAFLVTRERARSGPAARAAARRDRTAQRLQQRPGHGLRRLGHGPR
jgi:acetyl-CoA acetyltransferase